MTIREIVHQGIAQASWTTETILELLLEAIEHHEDYQSGSSRPYVESLQIALETDKAASMGPYEDDGQPDDLKEHEDFAKDGDLDNTPGDEIL